METEVVNTVDSSATPAATALESKWYVLRVVSGKEKKIKEYLDKDIVRNNWSNIIKQVFYQWKKYIKYKMVKK